MKESVTVVRRSGRSASVEQSRGQRSTVRNSRDDCMAAHVLFSTDSTPRPLRTCRVHETFIVLSYTGGSLVEKPGQQSVRLF